MNNRQRSGIQNLVHHCIGVKAGQNVLIIKEANQYDYFDSSISDIVERELSSMGVNTTMLTVPLCAGPESIPAYINAAVEQADHTVFFARIGDQLRFSPFSGKGTRTMCYALNNQFLGSEFCTISHDFMAEVLEKLERELSQAREWRITCPLGTDVSGICERRNTPITKTGTFSLYNFPIGTFKPVSGSSLNGHVVLSKWLSPTGYHLYEPDYLLLEEPVMVTVNQGRIIEFEGDGNLVEKVRHHYESVSRKLDIDPCVVHSWHAGINHKTFYDRPPEQDLSRWSNLTFSSPRRVHFHTCGAYAPGEIAWNVFDATVYFDNKVYWKDGRFVFLERADIKALLEQYGYQDDMLEMRRDIGI